MNNSDPIEVVLATRIKVHAQAAEENFSFDPLTIMAIINCIIAIGRLLYECYTNRSDAQASYYKAVKKPGAFSRLMMRRYIYQNCRKHTNKAERKVLYHAMLDVASTMSDQEINEFVQSVNEE